jgi:hypothetical protein
MRLRPTLACVALLLALSAAGASVASPQLTPQAVAVPAGGNLQQAIDAARPGDTITLDPGATYVGNFVLPVKQGNQFITIRTSATSGQPAAGERVSPDHAPLLAKIRSPNGSAALRTAAGAHHWRLELLEFQANNRGTNDIILLGDGSTAQTELQQVPFELVVDRCFIHGDPEAGQKRGIALNSASTSIVNSHLSDMKVVGQDSQAIGGWNGPGPFLIENNFLEAAGENFLLGGADPAIPNLIPSDVTFRKNLLSKPIEWRKQRWQVKNLFELKNARRVLIEGNVFEYNWHAAQTGFAIVLTPRNSGGRSPWAVVEDVTFRLNVVRHVAAVFNLLGTDNTAPSGQLRRVTIANNLFADVDHRAFGGNGAFLQVGDGPSDVRVEHNTIIHSGNVISAYGGTRDRPVPIVGLTYRDNLSRHNQYGVIGASRAFGNDTLNVFFPGALFTSNVLAGGNGSRYPGGNFFPGMSEFESQFADFNGGDYRLATSSRYRRGASDGTDLGANLDSLEKVAGVEALRERRERQPRPPRIPKGPGGSGGSGGQ